MAESDLKLRREPHLEAAAPEPARIREHYDDDEVVDLAPYLLAIRERWRRIAVAALAAAAGTFLIAALVLPKWYRSAAVVRPIATPAIESRIAGVLGGLGGGLGGLGGIAASLGAGGNNDAEEYIAILRGFHFNVNLAQHHKLSDELLKPGLISVIFGLKPKDPNWAIYRALEKRFDCNYSTTTGDITLYFEARGRQNANRILGYYIDDLRDLLRQREIDGAAAAIESLKAEAGSTADAVLRTELYQLEAKQVQRKKMAQVEADFAFRLLDPPAASDEPYSPRPALDSVAVALLTVILMSLVVAVRNAA